MSDENDVLVGFSANDVHKQESFSSISGFTHSVTVERQSSHTKSQECCVIVGPLLSVT